MAKPVGNKKGIHGNSPADQQDGAGQSPLRPRVGYKARGQGLEDLANTDLIPAPGDSAKKTKPRQITDDSAGAASGGTSKALIFGGIAAVVVVVGGFLALSESDTAPATVVAATETAAPVEAVSEPTAPETDAGPIVITTAPTELGSITPPGVQATLAPETADDPSPAVFASDVPELALTATPPAPFTCDDCSIVVPELATVTVVLFQPSATMSWDAATRLRALGVGAVAMSDAAIPSAKNQIRYYSQDALAAAQILATRYDATLVDLTWYDPAPAASNIDLWLAQ